MTVGTIGRHYGILGKVIGDSNNAGCFKFLPCEYGEYTSCELETVDCDNFTEATLDDKRRYIECEYSWASVVQTHMIGDYQIIEDSRGSFHLYINFKDSGVLYSSLDAALLGAVCRKYDGVNERLSDYMCRALGINKLKGVTNGK